MAESRKKRTQPRLSDQPTGGLTTATGLLLLGLGALPAMTGVLVLVGYGVANSNDLGTLLVAEAILALLALIPLAAGVRLLVKAPNYPTGAELRRTTGRPPH